MPAGATPTLYNLNSNAGPDVSIPCTKWPRRMEIVEDASGVAQGLIARFVDDNYTQAYQYGSGDQPIVIGDPVPQGNAKGRIIGGPANNSGGGSRPADVPVKLRSATANATKVRVVEYD